MVLIIDFCNLPNKNLIIPLTFSHFVSSSNDYNKYSDQFRCCKNILYIGGQIYTVAVHVQDND